MRRLLFCLLCSISWTIFSQPQEAFVPLDRLPPFQVVVHHEHLQNLYQQGPNVRPVQRMVVAANFDPLLDQTFFMYANRDQLGFTVRIPRESSLFTGQSSVVLIVRANVTEPAVVLEGGGTQHEVFRREIVRANLGTQGFQATVTEHALPAVLRGETDEMTVQMTVLVQNAEETTLATWGFELYFNHIHPRVLFRRPLGQYLAYMEELGRLWQGERPNGTQDLPLRQYYHDHPAVFANHFAFPQNVQYGEGLEEFPFFYFPPYRDQDGTYNPFVAQRSAFIFLCRWAIMVEGVEEALWRDFPALPSFYVPPVLPNLYNAQGAMPYVAVNFPVGTNYLGDHRLGLLRLGVRFPDAIPVHHYLERWVTRGSWFTDLRVRGTFGAAVCLEPVANVLHRQTVDLDTDFDLRLLPQQTQLQLNVRQSTVRRNTQPRHLPGLDFTIRIPIWEEGHGPAPGPLLVLEQRRAIAGDQNNMNTVAVTELVFAFERREVRLERNVPVPNGTTLMSMTHRLLEGPYLLPFFGAPYYRMTYLSPTRMTTNMVIRRDDESPTITPTPSPSILHTTYATGPGARIVSLNVSCDETNDAPSLYLFRE